MNPNYLEFEQPIATLEAKIEELQLVGNDNDINNERKPRFYRATQQTTSDCSHWIAGSLFDNDILNAVNNNILTNIINITNNIINISNSNEEIDKQ